MWSCANIGRPSGGDQDTAGPEVIGVLPYPGTLYFNYKEIVFHFDEFLKPGNYKNEVFISPVPTVDPEIVVKNKTLTIKFIAPLRDSTTYVVSLGTGILDFNEGNKMETSYTYAFSTGGVLDSLTVSGRVEDVWSGAAEKDMKIMLFRAGEIDSNNIKGKRPEYLVASDKYGMFDFKFLAPGDYEIYGVGDANSDSRYSGESEKIGLTIDPLIMLRGEDSAAPKVALSAFFQDFDPPKVKSAKWSNDQTIHLEFTKPLRNSYAGENLVVFVMDTTGSDPQLLEVARFKYKNQNHLYLHSPVSRDKDYDIRLVNLMDSLGNKGDTVVRLIQEAQVKEERKRWYDMPVNERQGHDFFIPTLFKVQEGMDSTQIQLLDSAAKPQDIVWMSSGMVIFGKPTKLLDPNMPYKLQFRKTVLLPNGKPTDTLVVFDMMFPNPNDFGTVSGKVLADSTRPSLGFSVILRGNLGTGLLTHPKSASKEAKGKSDVATSSMVVDRFEARFAAPGRFKYGYLYPGKYTIDIIDDTDGNGVLTPGSLNPYRMPEKVYHEALPLEVKAKWDMEDVEIYPIPQPGKSKGDKAATTEEPSGTPKTGGK